MDVCTVTRWIFASSCIICFFQIWVCGIYSFDDIQQSHHSQAAATFIKARNKIIHHRQLQLRSLLFNERGIVDWWRGDIPQYLCLYNDGCQCPAVTWRGWAVVCHHKLTNFMHFTWVASCWLIKPLSDSAFFKINWWSFMKFMKNWRNFKTGPHLPGCQAGPWT